MRASESTAVFGRSPWLRASALKQFHPEPGLDEGRAVHPNTDKPFFAKRTEPAGIASTEVSFGPFRLLPTQFLLLEGGKAGAPGKSCSGNPHDVA